MSRFFRITLALVSIAFAGVNMAQAAQEKQSGRQPDLLTTYLNNYLNTYLNYRNTYPNTHLDQRLAIRCKGWGPAANSDRQRCGEALYAGGTNGGFDG
jgi:hypothetical protein